MTYDYNSSRKKLILPEYGRNIQKMVNHIKTIEDRDERNKAAKTVIGVMGNAGQANYSASKAGLIGLTKSAAKEFASRGVTVNAVAPGYIQTAMTEALPEEMKAAMLSTVPLGTAGTPRDVSNVVLFLAGEEAGYITGQVLQVDGGMVM